MADTGRVISIVGRDDDADVDRGMFEKPIVRSVIDVHELEQRVKDFLAAMESVLGNISPVLGNYEMDAVTVTAEVSAKGTVSLLGTGGEVGAKGGMTFTFKRATPPKS